MKWIAEQKLTFDIGWNWFAAPGLGLVIAKTAQDVLIRAGVSVALTWILPVMIFLVWGVGFVVIKSGMFRATQDMAASHNSYLETLKENK